MSVKIKLSTVENATMFVKRCGKYPCDIDYKFGRYTIDAKSLLGIMSTDITKEALLEIHTDDNQLREKIMCKISPWIITD